jgi:hypothetical protein
MSKGRVRIFQLVGIAISSALLIGATNSAQAAYPCRDGYTLQDGYCKPYRGPHSRGRGYYRGGYYGGGPYYGGGYYGGGPYYYGGYRYRYW